MTIAGPAGIFIATFSFLTIWIYVVFLSLSNPFHQRRFPVESKIRIYGKSAWPFTTAAREAYAKKDVEVEYIDVLENDDDMKVMLELTDGNRRVPVIADGENIAIGFGGRSWRV